MPLHRYGQLSPPMVATPGHIHEANVVALCSSISAPFSNCVGERVCLVEELGKHLEHCVYFIPNQFVYTIDRILRYPTSELQQNHQFQ